MVTQVTVETFLYEYFHATFLHYFILVGGPLIAKQTDGTLTVVGILRKGYKK